MKSKENKEIRMKLSQVLQQKGAIEFLESQVIQPSPETASALAFIALIIKDYGGLCYTARDKKKRLIDRQMKKQTVIEESATLYHHAFQNVPKSSSYALNYVHTVEVLGDYPRAFEGILEYLRANLDFEVGLLPSQTLRCSQIYQVIKDLDLSSYQEQLCGEPARLFKERGVDLAWYPESGAKLVKKKPTRESEEIIALPKQSAEYRSEELDLLALLFTLVKIIFNAGMLSALPGLIELIEPVRTSTAKPLHQTLIRNEHAYYCCIVQLLETILPTLPILPKEALAKPLYMCGDSHSQPPAWHVLNIHGEARLLVPMLVTGMKCWHLRPESRFYPKSNFYNVVEKRIPCDSQVVFMFGEIDCREGILVAVSKMKYESVEEGM